MSDFYPCYSLPGDLYPYWIMAGHGGNSPCIQGKPPYQAYATISNCVGWAWGRYQQIREQAGFAIDWRLPANNAGYWFGSAQRNGMSTGQEPALGAVLCFAGGHVAIVEEIAEDESYILTSESDWGGAAFSLRQRWASNNYVLSVGGFQGFIYNVSDLDPGPEPPEPPEPDPGGDEGYRFKWWMARQQIIRKIRRNRHV